MSAPEKQSPLAKVRGMAMVASFMFGLFATGVGGYFVKQGMETDSWSTAPGEVDISRMETEQSRTSGQSGSTMVDVARIGYWFEVGGQTYRGERISTFDLRVGRNTERAQATLAEYPVGKTVQVHYDPADPNRAVLVAGAQQGAWNVFGVGVGLVLFSFVLGTMGGGKE